MLVSCGVMVWCLMANLGLAILVSCVLNVGRTWASRRLQADCTRFSTLPLHSQPRPQTIVRCALHDRYQGFYVFADTSVHLSHFLQVLLSSVLSFKIHVLWCIYPVRKFASRKHSGCLSELTPSCDDTCSMCQPTDKLYSNIKINCKKVGYRSSSTQIYLIVFLSQAPSLPEISCKFVKLFENSCSQTGR